MKLVDALGPGLRVWTSGLGAEPLLLRDELAADPQRAAGVTFLGVQFPGLSPVDYLAFHPQARQWNPCFMTPGLRRGMQEGRAEVAGLDYLAALRHLQDLPPVDVAVAHLTPPDADGWCSPGSSCDFLPLIWPRARRRIAHLNPRLPRTAGSFRVHVSELDGAVEADLPLPQYHDRPGGATEMRIAGHVANLVRDGDTLQFGIGGVPLGVAAALRSHRRLKLHAGMLAQGLRTLWEAGAVDADARITTGALFGDAEFLAFAAGLPRLWLTDVRGTHDPVMIGQIPRFIAINGAIEVDLFGQVNAERAGGVLQAGAGGLPAFAQGALRSAGGRLLVCLPATAKGGTVSRIVPALGSQAVCTLPRALADVIVTEHGAAELRGRSLEARAAALIAIAAPEHREALAREWDQTHRAL